MQNFTCCPSVFSVISSPDFYDLCGDLKKLLDPNCCNWKHSNTFGYFSLIHKCHLQWISFRYHPWKDAEFSERHLSDLKLNNDGMWQIYFTTFPKENNKIFKSYNKSSINLLVSRLLRFITIYSIPFELRLKKHTK